MGERLWWNGLLPPRYFYSILFISCPSMHLPVAQPFMSLSPLLNTECPSARTMCFLSGLTGTEHRAWHWVDSRFN